MSSSPTPHCKDVEDTILQGDALVIMKTMADESIDCSVTDPPYELGIMGRAWDRSGIAYSVELWCEVLRVLKPGAHLLAFGGARTYHRIASAIEEAGFELRDQIMWVYGSGLPKSLDVHQAINKAVAGCAGPCSPDRPASRRYDEGAWQGWGTALKPAHESICVARKPLIGTVAENVLRYGTGALNIDACRVGTDEVITNNWRGNDAVVSLDRDNGSSARDTLGTAGKAQGRHPSNLIHDGSEEVLRLFPVTRSGKPGTIRNGRNGGAAYGAESRPPGTPMTGFGDSGSAARFFYTAKSSAHCDIDSLRIGGERHAGCEGLFWLDGKVIEEERWMELRAENMLRKDEAGYKEHLIAWGNIHPTVKPVALMAYLVRLVCPPGGVVIDPFCGSGSTLVGAVKQGYRYIGIELDANYCMIAQRRVDRQRKTK